MAELNSPEDLNKGGVKYDSDKERFDLLPARPLFLLAQVSTFGSKKYSDRNCEKGMKWGRIFAALMRHSWKFWMGEIHDEETGLPHMAHAMWCCMMLLEYMFTHKEFDDRTENQSTYSYFQKQRLQ